MADITASRQARAAESSTRGALARRRRETTSARSPSAAPAAASARRRSCWARASRTTAITSATANAAVTAVIAASVAVYAARRDEGHTPRWQRPRIFPDGASGLDAAAAVGPRLAKAAVAVQVDGEVRDLRLPLRDGESVRIITDRDPEALAVLRHSTAHVMAQAVLHLWPDTKIAIGPAIADGFYYDFEFPQPLGADDLERIEAEMRRILASPVRVRPRGRRRQGRAPEPVRGPSTSRTSSSSPRGCPTARSASIATTTSRICAAGRTCRRPRRSGPSSCSRRRVPTGAATRRGRC